MESVNCDFCGSSTLRQIHRVDTTKFHPDYLQAISIVGASPPQYFIVAECEKCGLVFLNPRYTGAELMAAYPDEQYNDRSGYFSGSILFKRSGAVPAIRLRGEIVESSRNIERMERICHFKKSGRALDIGCCNGSFLALLQQNGWDAYGIDFSSAAIENARREFSQEQTFCGELLDAGYPDNYFDVITMYDTIEHVPNPRAVLQEIKRISKPDALLVIQTNDFGSFNARLMPRSLIFPAQHLYYFRKRDLVRILRSLDYELADDHFSTIGPARYIYYFCMHWWTRFAVRLHCSERGQVTEGLRRALEGVGLIFSHGEMLKRLKMVGANNIPAFRADRTYYFLAQGQAQNAVAHPAELVAEGGDLR
jgi:SAM-dependent methyltransferase